MKTRWITAMIALCLSLCMLVGCGSVAGPSNDVPNEPMDGEIGGRGDGGSLKGEIAADDYYGGMTESDAADDMAEVPMAPMEPMAPGEVADKPAMEESADGMWSDMDVVIGGEIPGGGNIQYSAGMLTGSEWCDNDHFEDFVSKINAQDNGWYDIAARWGTVATERIHVRVTNGTVPLGQIKVVLYGADNAVLWQAVTDADGDAYLFWNLDRSAQRADAYRVEAIGRDGKSVTQTVSATTGEMELVLDTTNVPVKLDLMFVVDTTGSMGDELEYLKAELGDVVTRASQNGQIPVRTSVNFYRDEGDAYVVRYFDFREDVGEAVRLIADQWADGGGDYEEAVHTALDNAVNGHVWQDDAVKLVFLVLDAPPHEQADIVASIADTVRTAAEQGIRIIPVASSGVNTTCEVLFRTWAALTGGTYTYLTNHSGIGNPHHEPDVEAVQVEMLNDMLVRIIGEYCK